MIQTLVAFLCFEKVVEVKSNACRVGIGGVLIQKGKLLALFS